MPGTSSVVLLIESAEESRTVFADALCQAGFTVVAVPHYTAGRYALTEVFPQLVIAGFDARTHDECLGFCERLKADQRTQAIPILLISETIDREDLRRATEMRILGMSAGPHDGHKILAAVRGMFAVVEGRAFMTATQHSRSA